MYRYVYIYIYIYEYISLSLSLYIYIHTLYYTHMHIILRLIIIIIIIIIICNIQIRTFHKPGLWHFCAALARIRRLRKSPRYLVFSTFVCATLLEALRRFTETLPEMLVETLHKIPESRFWTKHILISYARQGHPADSVSFHNFKSQNFKLSVSNPKSKCVAYLSALSQISNCQGLGRKNKLEILKTYRTANFSIG